MEDVNPEANKGNSHMVDRAQSQSHKNSIWTLRKISQPHRVNFAVTESNPIKWAKLEGYLNKLKSAIYPIYVEIYWITFRPDVD